MANLSYHENVDKKNINKLRELGSELPSYCREFFRGIEPRTRSRTRIAYAYDLKVFFKYLLNNNPYLKKKYSDISEISLADLDRLKVPDFEEFMEYLKYR